MAMNLLAQHPMDDNEANRQWLALGGQTELEAKNLIPMRNLQRQLDLVTARLDALESP